MKSQKTEAINANDTIGKKHYSKEKKFSQVSAPFLITLLAIYPTGDRNWSIFVEESLQNATPAIPNLNKRITRS